MRGNFAGPPDPIESDPLFKDPYARPLLLFPAPPYSLFSILFSSYVGFLLYLFFFTVFFSFNENFLMIFVFIIFFNFVFFKIVFFLNSSLDSFSFLIYQSFKEILSKLSNQLSELDLLFSKIFLVYRFSFAYLFFFSIYNYIIVSLYSSFIHEVVLSTFLNNFEKSVYLNLLPKK